MKRNIRIAAVAALAALVVSSSGCSSRRGRVLSGTSTTIGIIVPMTGNVSASFNMLEYVSGLYLGISEDNDLELNHEMEIENSYFGVVSHKEKRKLVAHITNYGATNMLMNIENKKVELENEKEIKKLEVETRAREADAAIAVATACAEEDGKNAVALEMLKRRYVEKKADAGE